MRSEIWKNERDSDLFDSIISSNRRKRSLLPTLRTGPSTVAIYARCSTFGQAETSTDRQVQKCERSIQSTGDALYNKYIDEGLSGRYFVRPGLERLLIDAETRKFDLIVIESISRLGRDLVGLLRHFNRLEQLGIQIRLCDGTTVDRSRLILEGLLTELDLGILMKRLRDGRRKFVREGRVPHKTPIGYMIHPNEKGVLIPHPFWAPLIVEVFSRFASGTLAKTLALELSEDGIPVPSEWRSAEDESQTGEKMWDVRMIRDIIENPKYAGYIIDGMTTQITDCDSKSIYLKLNDFDQWDRITNPDIALISRELWLSAQSNLKKVLLGSKSYAKRGETLLSGLLFCGLCRAQIKFEAGSKASRFECSTAACQGVRDLDRGEIERTLLKWAARRFELRAKMSAAIERTEDQPVSTAQLLKMASRAPFKFYSDEDKRLGDVFRSIFSHIEILLKPENGGQELLIHCATEFESIATADEMFVGLAPSMEKAKNALPDAVKPFAAWQIRIADADWQEIEKIQKIRGLSFKGLSCSARDVIENLLIWCQTGEIPKAYHFFQSAERVIRSGFWQICLVVLAERSPLLLVGLRVGRVPVHFLPNQTARSQPICTAEDARDFARATDVSWIALRLAAVADVMSGKRLDLISRKRLGIEERFLAGWVICFRECGPWLVEITHSAEPQDRFVLDDLILERAVKSLDDHETPRCKIRILAVKKFLGGQKSDDVEREINVSWLTVRKWITAAMIGGLEEITQIRVKRPRLIHSEIEELRRIYFSGVDPEDPSAPITARILQRICHQRFGQQLSENCILYSLKNNWNEFAMGTIDLRYGVRTKVKEMVTFAVRENNAQRANEKPRQESKNELL